MKKESREMLRQRFQAQTDVEVDPQPEDWRRYAEWLERISIKKLNNELAEENEMLRNRMQTAMNVLEAGVTGAGMRREKGGFNYNITKISKAAVKLLGYQGRMLYPSKSMKKPTTIFNANIYNSKAEKIWHGDLEIERDRKVLIELSKREGAIYILWESDGWRLTQKPTTGYVKDRAVVVIKNRSITYSKEFEERVKVLSERTKQENIGIRRE